MDVTGPRLLDRYLEHKGFTQSALAAELARDAEPECLAAKHNVYKVLVGRWRSSELRADGTLEHRPTLTDAVRLQYLTHGEVPAVAGGYSEAEIESLLRAVIDLTTAHGIAATTRPRIIDRTDPDVVQVVPEVAS